MSGCACDIREWAQDRAGGDAVDCGNAPLGELHDDYYQCAVDAFRDGEAFFAVYERQGIDSEVRIGWASDGESVWIGSYDGDPSGGDGDRAEIHEVGCDGPFVDELPNGVFSNLTPGQEGLRCSGESNRRKVCP